MLPTMSKAVHQWQHVAIMLCQMFSKLWPRNTVTIEPRSDILHYLNKSQSVSKLESRNKFPNNLIGRNKPIMKYVMTVNGQRGTKRIGMKSQKIFEKKYVETR